MIRMNPLLLHRLAVGLLFGLANGAFAVPVFPMPFTEELDISVNLANTGLLTNPLTNTITYTNPDFNDWNISVVATSQSPNLEPFGLDLAVTASCTASEISCVKPGIGAIIITFSDLNFTQSTSAFVETFSGTYNGLGGTPWASFYYNSSNTLLSPGTFFGGVPFPPSGGVASITAGGPAGPSPYALTLVQTIYIGQPGPWVFSLNESITAVPEPGSVLLLGAGLAGLGLWTWRRTVSGGA